MSLSLEGMGGLEGACAQSNNLITAPDTCVAAKSPMLALYEASTALTQEFQRPEGLWGLVVQIARSLLKKQGTSAVGILRDYILNAESASSIMQGLATRLVEDKRRLHDFSRKNIEEYGRLVSGLRTLESHSETLETKYRTIVESLASLPHSSPEHAQYWLAEHSLREKLQDSSSERVLQASRIPRMDSMITIAADVEKTMSLAITYSRLAVQHTTDNLVLINEISPSMSDYLLTGKRSYHLASQVSALHRATCVVVGAFGKTVRAMAHVYHEATGASPAAKGLRVILQTAYDDAERLSSIASEAVLAACANELSKTGLSYDSLKTKDKAA